LWKIILLLGFPNGRKFRTLLRAESFLSDLFFAQIASASTFGRGGIYNTKSKLMLTYALTSSAQLLNTIKRDMPGVSDWLIKIFFRIR